MTNQEQDCGKKLAGRAAEGGLVQKSRRGGWTLLRRYEFESKSDEPGRTRMTLLNVDEAGVAGYLILSQFRDIDVQDTILDLGSDVLSIRILRQGKHLLELLV